MAGTAQAQEQHTNFSIPSMPMAEAIAEFSRQSGVNVLAPTSTTEGLVSNAVYGSMDAKVALARMVGNAPRNIQASADGSLILASAQVEGGASSSAERAQNSGAPVEVSGRVRGSLTGTNLKGARVEILETGQTTSTDDLGRFRFPSVAPGLYTIRISYLGRETITQTVDLSSGGNFNQDYQLGFSADVGVTRQVEVYGSRSARAQALNQERTADNSQTVLSSDALGTFTGTTISESLRVAPGIAFELNPETGEGDNVIVRGLEAGFNQVTLNGLRLTNTPETFRTSNLSNVLTESIESVTINKTLLPSQDGSGTGALIEIETKSPLDRARRFAQVSVDGTERGEGFGRDRNFSGTVSGIFGESDDFGASFSVQYRDQDITRLGHEPTYFYGQYLPDGISGANQIDPATSFPFEDGVVEAYPDLQRASSAQHSSENLTLTGTLEKQLASHTNLRFDYTRSRVSSTDFSRSLSIDATNAYRLIPIDELGGEERFAFISERPASGSFPGVLLNVGQGVRYAPDNESEVDTISFRGESTTGNWEFNYGAGLSLSKSTRSAFNVGIENTRDTRLSALTESDVDPEVWARRRGGLIVSVYDPILPGVEPGFVFPRLTQSYFDRINDPSQFELSGPTLGNSVISQGALVDDSDRISFNVSARRSFDLNWLDYVEVGVFREEFTSSTQNTSDIQVDYLVVGDATAADLGLEFGLGILDLVGLGVDGYDILTEQSVIDLRSNLDQLADDGVLVRREFPRPNGQSEAELVETEFAAYLEAKLQFDKLEVIGGARLVDVNVDSRFVSRPSLIGEDGRPDADFEQQFTGIVEASDSQMDILPRILANYRHSDNLIFRAGYFTSVNRPAIGLLNRTQTPRLILVPIFGPNNDQPLLTVSQGNPDLVPSYTDNYDVSIEYYSDDIGAIKLSGFYKSIEDPFTIAAFEGGLELAPEDLTLPDAPEFNNLPDNVFIQVSQPVNNDDSIEIWGGEVSIERRFEELPGAFSGLGIFANLTYTDSSQTFQLDTNTNPDGFVEVERRLPGSPKYSGTAALTYNKYGFDSSLTYSWQDRRLISIQDFGLDEYNGEFGTLDFRLVYNGELWDQQYRLFFEGRDLMRDSSEASITREAGGERGVPTYYGLDDRYFGGRSFALGATLTF